MRRRALATAGLALLLATPAVATDQSEEPLERTVTGVGGEAVLAHDLLAPFGSCVDGVHRIAGADRWETAVRLGEAVPATDVVHLASGATFPDALAAAPTVAARDSLLLLTRPDALPAATRSELQRRQPAQVVVVGGPGAVSDDVVHAVESLGIEVTRTHGDDRYATAAALTATLPTGPAVAWVAAGAAFPDALAVGAVAARAGEPILLTLPDHLPAATRTALRDSQPAEVVVVGGTGAVGDAVLDDIRALGFSVRRIEGDDRYETAAAVAASAAASSPRVLLATGTDFADALAAGPVAAATGATLLLAGTDLGVSTATVARDVTDSDCRVVDVSVDAVEALTLGPSSIGGTTLTATGADGRVVLRDAEDHGALLVPNGVPADVTLSYPAPTTANVPAVSWQQALGDTATGLVARQPWRGLDPAPPGGITLAWQYTGDSDRYRDEVAAAPGLTVTAPFRYAIGTDGGLAGGADPAFIADMHAAGVDVWPTIHTCGATCIHAAFDSASNRSAIAHRISEDARITGADGVNIDVEGFHDEDGPAVTAFVEELSELVHAWGGVTSFDLTVMTDAWATPPAGFEFWSSAPDLSLIHI